MKAFALDLEGGVVTLHEGQLDGPVLICGRFRPRTIALLGQPVGLYRGRPLYLASGGIVFPPVPDPELQASAEKLTNTRFLRFLGARDLGRLEVLTLLAAGYGGGAIVLRLIEAIFT